MYGKILNKMGVDSWMQTRVFFKYKFIWLMMLCSVAVVVCLGIGITTYMHKSNTVGVAGSDDLVTVHYCLYKQRDVDAIEPNTTTQTWYDLLVPYGEKITAEMLDEAVADKDFKAAAFLNKKDRAKINNKQITWYISDKDKTKTKEELEVSENEFDFDLVIVNEYYIEGVIVEDDAELTETHWMFWAIIGTFGGIILVSIIMAIIRNRSTRLSLDNKGIISKATQEKVDTINEYEKRKSKYSPLKDDDELDT